MPFFSPSPPLSFAPSAMTKTQTIWMTALWGIVVAMMVGVVATRATRSDPKDAIAGPVSAVQGQSPQAAKFSPLFDVPDFQLVDQAGKTITRKDLLGAVW